MTHWEEKAARRAAYRDAVVKDDRLARGLLMTCILGASIFLVSFISFWVYVWAFNGGNLP